MSMVTIELLHEDSYDMNGGLVGNNFVARVYTRELNGPALFTSDSFLGLHMLVDPRAILKNIDGSGLLTEAETLLLIDDIQHYGYDIADTNYQVWGGEE